MGIEVRLTMTAAIVTLPVHFGRNPNIAQSHPSALIIVLPTEPKQSVADQMHEHAIFPNDDVFTDADGFLGGKGRES